jgi:signal transduction histidine kinase
MTNLEGTNVSPPSMPAGARSERAQTDESLRVERETADDGLEEKVAAIDEAADAVISLARARADHVLAAARAKADGRSGKIAPAQSAEGIKGERRLHDQIVREEREVADESLRTERGERIASLLTERERTDNDLLNERVRADGALSTRDEFLAIVSHDLRDMLDAMIRFAVLIEKEAAQADQVEPVRTHAQRIRRSGARMGRLIGDLIDVAGIESGTLAVTRELADPAQVVREAVDTFQALASARGVTLLVDITPWSSPAEFDPARILQVLGNLLANAIKFTSAGGQVTARVELSAGELRFAVSDTGIGIPDDQLEAVFERLLQVTKDDRRGVGLGLYISKCIVQGHGGRIWAESRLGQGSTVYFTLPVHASA